MESPNEQVVPHVESFIPHEGNESIILVSRFHNSTIKSQVVATLHKAYELWAASGKDSNRILFDSQGVEILQPVIVPSLEEIAQKYDEHLNEIEKVTKITTTGRSPESNTMDLNWKSPDTGKLSTKQSSITEAHEKGHFIREYPGEIQEELFAEVFAKGFDPNAISIDVPVLQKKFKDTEMFSVEKTRQIFFGKIFSPNELAERMSQMKNYFGFIGSEKFTKEHLRHARENYVRDTGVDNWMTETFQAITKEKEDGFIELINTVGI